MPRKAEKYAPENNVIMDSFEKHNGTSSISLKMYDGKILACMTMKPIDCNLNNKQMTINYVDLLCVQKLHRKKNYAPRQIFTHVYHRQNQGNGFVFFLKRK